MSNNQDSEAEDKRDTAEIPAACTGSADETLELEDDIINA